MIRRLVFLCTVIFLLSNVLKLMILRLVRMMLMRWFPEKLTFKPRSLLNIATLKAESRYMSVDVCDFCVTLNLIGRFFRLNARPLVYVECRRCAVVLKVFPLPRQESRALTLTQWAGSRVVIVLFVLILKSVHLVLNDLSVTVFGRMLHVQKLVHLYKRRKNNVFNEIRVDEVVLSHDVPLALIPQIRASAEGTTELIKYLFMSASNLVKMVWRRPSLVLKDGYIVFTADPIVLEVSHDVSACGLIELAPVKIILPELSLPLNSVRLSVNEIKMTRSDGELKNVVVTNGDVSVIEIPCVKTDIEEKLIHVTSVNARISLALLLDTAMIAQFFVRTDTTPRPFTFPFELKCEYVKVDIVVSDIYCFTFAFRRGLKIHNSVLSSPEGVAIAAIEGREYRIVRFYGGIMTFENTRSIQWLFDQGYMNFPLDLAVASLMKDLAATLAFIAESFRGKNYVRDRNEPQTPVKLMWTVKNLRIEMLKKSMVDNIVKAVEAKRIAAECLAARRKRAFDVLTGEGKSDVDLERMERCEEEMKFRLFKEYVRGMKTSPEFMVIECVNAWLCLDGYKFPTFWDAFAFAQERMQKGSDDEVGRLNGMGVDYGAERMKTTAERYGEICAMRDVRLAGQFCILKQKVTRRSEIMHCKMVCDGREILIPMPSTEPVIILDVHIAADKAIMKLTRAILEVTQDVTMNWITFNRRPFAFTRLTGMNRIEVLFFAKFGMSFRKFKLLLSPSRPYLVKEYPIELVMEKFNIIMERLSMQIDVESAKLFIEKRRMAKFPRIVVELAVESVREGQCDKIFIGIDSSRLCDKTYAPYEKYVPLSHNITATASLDCVSDAEVKVDLDVVADSMTLYGERLHLKDGYSVPVRYLRKNSAVGSVSSVEFKCQIPRITVIRCEGSVFGRFNAFECNGKATNDEFVAIDINCSDIGASLWHFSTRVGSIVMVAPTIVVSGLRSVMRMTSVIAEIGLEGIEHFRSLDIGTAPSEVVSGLSPDLKDEDLSRLFNIERVALSIGYLRINVPSESHNIQIEFRQAVQKKFVSDHTRAKMTVVQFMDFVVHVHEILDDPIIRITETSIHRLIAADRQFLFLVSQEVSCYLRPDILNVAISERLSFSPKMRMASPSAKVFASRTEVTVCGASLHLANTFGIPLATVCLKDIAVARYHLEDGTENDELSVGNIGVTADGLEEGDPFRAAVETNSKTLFYFSRHKRKDMMTCPVFDEVLLKLDPIIVRISRAVIDEIIHMFPSANDLNVFDLESDVSNVSEIPDSPELNSFTKTRVGFYGHIHVDGFHAMMSYRGKLKAPFNEFLDRQFEFVGLDIYDTFGTKEQLKDYMKDHLRWAIIRALPKMAIRKTRERSSSDLQKRSEYK